MLIPALLFRDSSQIRQQILTELEVQFPISDSALGKVRASLYDYARAYLVPGPRAFKPVASERYTTFNNIMSVADKEALTFLRTAIDELRKIEAGWLGRSNLRDVVLPLVLQAALDEMGKQCLGLREPVKGIVSQVIVHAKVVAERLSLVPPTGRSRVSLVLFCHELYQKSMSYQQEISVAGISSDARYFALWSFLQEVLRSLNTHLAGMDLLTPEIVASIQRQREILIKHYLPETLTAVFGASFGGAVFLSPAVGGLFLLTGFLFARRLTELRLDYQSHELDYLLRRLHVIAGGAANAGMSLLNGGLRVAHTTGRTLEAAAEQIDSQLPPVPVNRGAQMLPPSVRRALSLDDGDNVARPPSDGITENEASDLRLRR